MANVAPRVKITDLVEKYGKDKIIFTLLMRRVNGFMGMTNSEVLDPYAMVDARLIEKQFKIAPGYKVTLEALDVEHYGEIVIPQRELEGNIQMGHVTWRIKE